MTAAVSQDQEEQAYFAVFDGHGGVDAAIYAANHLHVNLVHQESFSQDPCEALCRAFKMTDEGFVKKASREVSASAHSFKIYYGERRDVETGAIIRILNRTHLPVFGSTCVVAQRAW